MRWHWFGTVLVVLATAPSCVGGDDTHGEALCESPALSQEHHVTPRFSTCMLRCAAQAMLEMAKSAVSLKLNEGQEGKGDGGLWEGKLPSLQRPALAALRSCPQLS